jgi:D-sedoheptulose 7-phosphate isomerase
MARVFINCKAIVEEHVFLAKRFFEAQSERINEIADILVRTLQGGNKVLLFGNGGSAADAQHIAAELVGRFQYDRPGLPAIALTTDSSALTSIANDYGYEFLFARQIEALGQKGDLAIAISTSGRSANIKEGVLAAKSRGLVTVGLLGKEGGQVRDMVDHALVVDAQKTSRIQEIHIIIGHILCEAVEQELFQRRM